MSKINKNILFCFSDPAGAKAILSFIKINKSKIYNYLIISNKNYKFYENFNLDIKIIKTIELHNIIKTFKPNIIITGTSLPNEFELNTISIGNINSITTISFIDHYTNIIERFKKGNKFILPKFIFVINCKVKLILTETLKINTSRIKIIENPYITLLKKKKFNFSKVKFKKYFNVIDKKILLYLPEPLFQYKQDYLYGFTEFEILNDIIKYTNFDKFKLIIKPHPNHNIKLFEKYSIYNNVHIEQNFDINEMIYCSDIVFGIFSNAIIESNIINPHTYQILTHLKDKKLNPFHSVKNLKKINYNDEFINKLK